MENQKRKQLIKSISYDAIGMISMSVPVVGPFLDLVWAPYAARKMAKMYPGTKGKFASVLVFFEEVLPFTDVIPTFTLMWAYTYIWKREDRPSEISVEAKIL